MVLDKPQTKLNDTMESLRVHEDRKKTLLGSHSRLRSTGMMPKRASHELWSFTGS